MKQKLLSTFCCLFMLFWFGQNIYATVNEKTITQVTWNKGDLNSIQNNKFVKSLADGFATVTISGEQALSYSTASSTAFGDYMGGYGHLICGSLKKGELKDTLYWSANQSGYTIQMSEVKALIRSYATTSGKVWCAWNNGGETDIHHNGKSNDPTDNVSTFTTSNIAATTTSIPFKFRRDAESRSLIITQLELKAYVIPNAPVWKAGEANMDVTVSQKSSDIHWYSLRDMVEVSNAVFAQNVTYELVSGKAENLIWNNARDSFYVLMPGDYEFKTYIEKSEEQFCSSDYASGSMVVHASIAPSEEANAQVFFIVDGQLATEVSHSSHRWECPLFYEQDNSHTVEYGFSVSGATISIDKRTEHAIHFADDADLWSDQFSVDDKRLKDTIEVTVNGTITAQLVLTVQKPNHVPFVLNSSKKKDLLVTTPTTDASWNASTNRMEFAYKDLLQMGNKRSFEVTFTGIPDSVFFGYGNNSDYSAALSSMVVEYATVGSNSYTELYTRSGKPTGTEYYQFALKPNVNRLRFTYSGVQKVGWISNLTVTERKEIKITAPVDTILLTGPRDPEAVVRYEAQLDWYNITPNLHWMATSDTDADLFGAEIDNIHVQIDEYAENQPINFYYKPRRLGVHTTDILVYGGDVEPTADMAASKLVARYALKGITAYGAEDVTLTHAIDTVVLPIGYDVDSLFFVLDQNGQLVENDSIVLTYTYDSDKLHVDQTGKVTSLSVGYHQLIADMQANLLMPAKSDTLCVYVPESDKNTVLFSDNMLDTMIIGKTYDMLTYTATRGGNQIDSLFIEPENSALIDQFSLTPSIAGKVTIYAQSMGSHDYPGPDTAYYVVRFVNGVLPISWEDYLDLSNVHPGTVLPTSEVPVYATDSTDITSIMTKSYMIVPADGAHVDATTGNIVIDELAEEMTIIITTSGQDYQTRIDTLKMGVTSLVVGDVVYPSETYRAGDVIAISDIKVLDINSDDISSKAELTFLFDDPSMAEVVGDSIVINKSGLLDFYAHITGLGIVEITDTTTFSLQECLIGKIIYPEMPIEQYFEGDTIFLNSIIVENPDGRDVTRLATIEWVVTPQGRAHTDENGNLVFDAQGSITIDMVITGNHIADSTLTFEYTIRHDESRCYDLMVQLWEDVLVVDNLTEGYNSFVRYEWYKNEALLPNENQQAYHAPQGEGLNGTYYAVAYDEEGNTYLLCEMKFEDQSSAAAVRQFSVYPSMVASGESYVVETAGAGEVSLTNSHGMTVERYVVETGKNTAYAPSLKGVYIVRYTDQEGQTKMQKMIVK